MANVNDLPVQSLIMHSFSLTQQLLIAISNQTNSIFSTMCEHSC